ncbi:MAG TPA: hypothetical protein VGM81_12075 [Burkholderiaceae bacterium]|jgi:Tfp pilus assembly protein PilX
MQRHLLMSRAPSAERGVVLILAIVVLVAMSLAALALMRAVNTGNRVAGNLAFQQSATLSADAGVEAAVAWLEQNRISGALWNNGTAASTGSNTTGGGYAASTTAPTAATNWDTWWTAAVTANTVNKLAPDTAGNTVQYAITRLCNGTGDPTGNIGCQTAPNSDPTSGGSKGAGGNQPITAVVQYYYRVTVRVDGVRGTVSYVQVVVAM